MGIDPDAYMAGAIPSLNRGGSWRQDDIHSANQSTTSYGRASGGAIFPRPSQIVPQPQPAPSVGGNRSNAHFSQTPWAVRPPFAAVRPGPLSVRPPVPTAVGVAQSSAGGGGCSVSGKAPTVGPTKHPGWANLHAGGYRSSPTSPTVLSSAGFIASQAGSQYGIVKPPALPSHRNIPLLSPRLAEPIWEYDSGSPKPMTAEPDYFALPASPGVLSAPHTPTGMAAHQDSLPPPPKPAPQSPRPRIDSSKATRPALSRRHTHDRYSPEMIAAIERAGQAGKIDSKSLGRTRAKSGLRKPTFDIGSEAGESYYAPSSKTHTVSPPSTSFSTGVSTVGQPSTRPSTSRRSTATNPTTLKADSVRSFADRRFKNRSHPALSTIVSTADSSRTAPNSPTSGRSTTQSARLPKSASRPSLPTIVSTSSTVDFTQTAPTTPVTRAPESQSNHPSLNLRSLSKALPTLDQPGTTAPLTAPPSNSGYVHPTSEDGYDRYTAHPAAPVPPRADLPAETLAEATKPPMGAGLKHVTADTYRPPGFPKPLKEIGWNRDGPAMRTYGIAWLRDGTAEALPGRPAGPRWIQARPPASAAQSGGSWWESAG